MGVSGRRFRFRDEDRRLGREDAQPLARGAPAFFLVDVRRQLDVRLGDVRF
jgi:hypothetical protein